MRNFFRANKYYELKEFDKAIPLYVKSIHESEGCTAQAYYNIGVCYIKLKQYNEAIDNIKNALLFNKNSNYYFNLGYAYAMLDDYKNALINFKKAMDLNSYDSDCNNAINAILKANPDLNYIINENSNTIIKSKKINYHQAEFEVKNTDSENIAININALTQQRRLLKQINKALDDKDKEKFIRLTNRLHKINEKVLVKI